MIAIRKEIEEIENGTADKHDNVLLNSPHTAAEVIVNDWNHKYSRKDAAFPVSWLIDNKFWPSVKRVDQAYGDRNLVCTCLPMEAYAEAAV